MSPPRPVVGIPADRRIHGGHPFHQVGEKYLRAVTDGADAIALAIPSMATSADIDELLPLFDGILFTGSPSDIEPHHYDGGAAPEGTMHDPDRDALTLPLALRAVETGVPVFAVCRGFQEMNVAFGGSLHQRVHEVPGMMMHKENPDEPLDAQYAPAHDVHLVDGGLLRALAGRETVKVNSLHGQGVRRLAKGLVVEAVADDGLVEAFRVGDAAAFNLAVQWHPEWRFADNDFSTAMFRAFGDACRARARERQV